MTARPQPRVVQLTRDFLDRHLSALVPLDRSVRARMGNAYSDEAWGEEAFRHDLPGKWEDSIVVLEDERVCGFWIASHRSPQIHYTHRVAVAPEARSLGVGTLMFEAVAQRARAGGFDVMGLSVSVQNPAAMRFYERLGFVRANGAEIGRILGRPVDRLEDGADSYRTASGHRNHVYLLHLTDPNA